MPALDHSAEPKSGEPHMVLCDANVGDIRLIKLPALPVRVTIGPALDATGTVASGTLTYTVRKAAQLTDSAALPAVADDAKRGFIMAGERISFVVSGIANPAELGVAHSISAGYTQITYEPGVGT